jgi:hypothetical protein
VNNRPAELKKSVQALTSEVNLRIPCKAGLTGCFLILSWSFTAGDFQKTGRRRQLCSIPSATRGAAH